MRTSSEDDSMELTTCATVQALISGWVFAASIITETSSPLIHPKTKLHLKYCQRHVCPEGPVKFKQMHLLYIWSFNHLLGIIKQGVVQLIALSSSSVSRRPKMKKGRLTSEVLPELRLGMTLWYLSGGSVWYIQNNYEFSVI